MAPVAKLLKIVQMTNFKTWRGGAMVGCRTCDQEVMGSIPGQVAAA